MVGRGHTTAWGLAAQLGITEKIEESIQVMLSTRDGSLSREVLLRTKRVKLRIGRGRAARWLGFWNWTKSEIMIHKCLFEDEGQLIATLLHEFAHALHYFGWLCEGDEGELLGTAHGAEWKAWARAVGCEPCAYSSHVPVAAAHSKSNLKPVLYCNGCGHVVKRVKRFPSTKTYTHKRCGGMFRHV